MHRLHISFMPGIVSLARTIITPPEKEKGMPDVVAAQKMLDTFASVGACSFVVTKTDLLQQLKWGKTYSLDDVRHKLPAMVRTAAIRRPITLDNGQTVMAGENLIIRPIGTDVALVQLDDLKSDQLHRIAPAVFLLYATSPGSYQGWIAVKGLPKGKEHFKELTRRVRKAVGATDKSASHATRMAGTENFKLKYNPDFPVVTLIETHPGRVMTPEQLDSLGLLAVAEPVKLESRVVRRGALPERARQWPSYEMALAGAPPSDDGSGPDRSRADFWWCYLALQRGWSSEDTEAKLLEVSEKARERERGGDAGYVHITVTNAGAWLERNRERTRA